MPNQGFHPALVVSLNPLMVQLKGSSRPMPASSFASVTPVVGMVVQIQLRSPLPPIIHGSSDPLDGGTGGGPGGDTGGGD